MGDGASVEGISRLLGKYLTIRDHTKLPILAAADGGDDTSEDDNRMWCSSTAK